VIKLVVLNDVGLIIEIVGFILFLFTRASPASRLLLNEGSDSKFRFLEKKLPDKIGLPLRVISIPLIVIGLAMQFSFFNP